MMDYKYSIVENELRFKTFKFYNTDLVGIEYVLDDIITFGEAIFLPYIEKVLNRGCNIEDIGGNICNLEIYKDVTKIILYFTPKGVSKEYVVQTKKLRQIIYQWIELNKDLLK